MDTAAVAINQDRPSVAPTDLAAVKARQRVAWSSGDYAVVGTTLQIVGEDLCEALDLRAGQRVLDVAAGNGNATLAAARRGCQVTSTDYVPALLERAGERAAADRLSIEFPEADAENLPFEDGAFDVAMSTFGVMFTPDQERAAAELLRVCRRGGKSVSANWTPTASSAGSSPRSARPSHRHPECVHPRWGNACPCQRVVRTARGRDQDRATALRVPVSVASALDPRLQVVLRADAEGVRGARRAGSGRPRGRDRPLDRAVQPLGRHDDGGAERIPRGGCHARLKRLRAFR